MAIRVLLGYRGALVREALSSVLAREPDLEVVDELARVDDVLPAALRRQAQVAVLDALLPGTVDVRVLCQKLPRLGILMLLDRYSSGIDSLSLARLAPRVGLIATDASLANLVDAIRHLVRGEAVMDAELAVAALTADASPLTNRERDVLRLAMTGAPPQEIAATLFLSPGTVRNYLSHILVKTGARTRIEAIRIAQDAGWI
ncbi:response regulator transcription factor [Jiangella gansuensis]|uniref:response regulator transcription factor n=1 Tax=Jiangella gansuensis TaxID=281473 RepID=UPI00047EB47E|nr:response regulator transcription factor [Jiangella gansuensis]